MTAAADPVAEVLGITVSGPLPLMARWSTDCR